MEDQRVKLRTLFDFTARVPNELTFKAGQTIILIDKHVSGMWKGELDGQIGLFPYNYAEEITDSDGAADEAASAPLITEGWLTKEGHIRKNWKRRWFVLRNGTLYYYAAKEDTKEKGSIPLKGYVVETADDITQKLHTFHLYDPRDLKRKQFYIRADNSVDLKNWIHSIQVVASQ